MPQQPHTVKINLPGGILPAGDLAAILVAAERADVEQVQVGHRQQLLLVVAAENHQQLLQQLAAADIPCELNADAHPNISSSYVAEEIFQAAGWLREGVYKDILDLFDYRPRVKINLVDATQTFVPFFTGNFNFIAADTNNYWYLYVRFPKTNTLYCWPHLVYSEDIPALSGTLERVIFARKDQFYAQPAADGPLLHQLVSSAGDFARHPLTAPLQLPTFTLPYYEGFNRYGDKLWLGIYRRDEQFSVAFLKDVCQVCQKTRLGQVATTPWKSLIIKGIALADQPLWEAVLRRHRINLHHAANELNWQVEDLCAYGLALKHELVRQLNEEDVRTHQLCFAIKTQPQTGLFGSVVVRPQQLAEGRVGLHAEQFEILHTRDFNPNSKDFISFRQKVSRESLSWYLGQLCHQFYEAQGSAEELLGSLYVEEPATLTAPPPAAAPPLHQCRHCLTRYDEAHGDPTQHVLPGTAFAALPASYCCPTCEASREDFGVVATIAIEVLK